jgi:hypothetical protein
MKRLFRGVLSIAILIPFAAAGCGSSSGDAAAKWDRQQPPTTLPVKPSKQSKVPQKPARKVRGFTVPTPSE